jgi:2-phospho-L-lactate guanylyltransferase
VVAPVRTADHRPGVPARPRDREPVGRWEGPFGHRASYGESTAPPSGAVPASSLPGPTLSSAASVARTGRRGWDDGAVSERRVGAPAAWTLVLPVQRAEHGKTRLVSPAGVDHTALARAIALDALDAVRRSAEVVRRVVVTSDPVVAAAAAAADDQVLPDPGAGLPAAIAAGIRAAVSRAPAGLSGPLGVLLADLPALRPDELGAALRAAAREPSAVVADHEGTGTVLLTALDPRRLRPAFGSGSARRHQELGAVLLDLHLPTLRQDVDVVGDLDRARALGLGRATAALLRAAGYPDPVQGTVHEFDTDTAHGSVLLDDGQRLPFDAEAFSRSGLRLLRVGQRLTLDLDGGRVVALRLNGV